MSEQSNATFNFGIPSDGREALEVIDDATAAMEAIELLFASCNNLHLFERQPNNKGLDGLIVIVKASREAVEWASNRLYEQLKAAGTDAPAATDAARGAERGRFIDAVNEATSAGTMPAGESTPVAGDTYPKVGPALTARDAAIAATVAKGYNLDQVARAVNLKKATVQKIVEKLRGDGTLPPDETGNLDRAANA